MSKRIDGYTRDGEHRYFGDACEVISLQLVCRTCKLYHLHGAFADFPSTVLAYSRSFSKFKFELSCYSRLIDFT